MLAPVMKGRRAHSGGGRPPPGRRWPCRLRDLHFWAIVCCDLCMSIVPAEDSPRTFLGGLASMGGRRPGRLTSITMLLVAGLYSGALAMRSHPAIALDDAAITFRYAERLADGKGFTYNDHERVLGASNPLYVIVLALATRTGAGVEKAATVIGVVAYGVCIALVVLISTKLAGAVAGVFAGLVLTADAYFRFQAVSGLEVGFALALAMGAIAVLEYRRAALAGILAGLAVWTKLDALALIAAVVCAEWVQNRRLPTIFLVGSAAASLPWFMWSTWYFGSPFPQSLHAKLAIGEGEIFDPLWVVRFLLEPSRWHLTVLAACAMVTPNRLGRAGATTRAVLIGWATAHVTAYSVVNLGAPYPWYLAAPVAPIAVLAGITVARMATAFVRVDSRRWHVLPVAILGFLCVSGAAARTTAQWGRRPIEPWEAFEADRRAAGRFLRQHASPGEILECAYGWPAFESGLPTNDSAGLNSKARLQPVSYAVEHGYPLDGGAVAPTAPAGMVPLATFDSASRRFPGHSWFVVFGRPGSAVAKNADRNRLAR